MNSQQIFRIALVILGFFIIASSCIAQNNVETPFDARQMSKKKFIVKDIDSSNIQYTICTNKGKVNSLRVKDTKSDKSAKGRRISNNNVSELSLLCLTDQQVDCYETGSLFGGSRIFCFCGARIFRIATND